jgi:translocation and assembly module TamB
MKRRSLVALVAAGVLVFLGLLAVSAVLFVTRTYRGREYVRSFAQPLIARAIKGNLYIGHLGGSFLNQLTIDSVAIRDERGELFVSTGPITLDYNPRDIFDARAFIRHATIEHPYVHVVQHNDYSWNFKKIFASSPSPAPSKDVNTRGWGSYVVADSVKLHDATFLVTLRWQPDDSLKGTRRDSVIRVTLANPARAVTPTYDGYGRLYAWRNINGLISHARLFDPDSDQKYGREFKVATLSADEFEPTFKFRNVVADARLQGDSVWFQSPHFELPASNGRGAGKVWWGSDLPVRYDIIVHGTSVALEDVNWAYPPLPTTGGGSVDLSIRNDPTNIQIVDFRLSNMDVKTTDSHVTGTMAFGIGAPVLLVRNVDLKGDPVDFDFLRYINQKPFSVDWRGQLYGIVKGRGGPLTHFVVDQSDVTFHDAHVPGATAHATGKGALDILFPAFTAFHHFDVNATSVDLRSIEYLFPAFPRLGGTVSGTATLDSSWLDVRFSNADVNHQDGPGEPSHLTGSGRITYGDPFMTYDVTLDARPLSLTMLSRSYPNPLRGLMSGPVKAQGQSPDLALTTTLTGEAGTFSFDGRVDLDSVGGLGARGHGQFSALSPMTLLAKADGPRGAFSGHYEVDVNGRNASVVNGTAGVAIERTSFDGVTIYPSRARATFGDGRMRVDTLMLETSAGTLEASGAIGLPKGPSDSLSFKFTLDSLGGLRRYLSSADSTAAPDSLSGEISVRGFAQGRLDSMRVAGTLTGNQLYVEKDKSRSVTVGFDIVNVPNAAAGQLTVSADSLTLAGVAVDTLGGRLIAEDASHARFTVGVQSHNGPLGVAGGTWSLLKNSWAVGLTSLDLVVGKDEWRLAGPARLERDSMGTRLDSLILRNRDTAVVAISGDVPNAGNVTGRVRATSLPLDDIGVIEQFADSVAGLGRVDATLSGTRDHPILTGEAQISGLQRNGVTLDRVTLNSQLHDRDADLSLAVVSKGATTLAASLKLPIDFKLFSVKTRNDAMSGEIHVPATDLSIVQLASRSFSQVTGTLRGDIIISGTPSAPVFRDTVSCGSALLRCARGVQIVNGSANLPQLGVVLADIQCTVSGAGALTGGDSLSISGCSATTPATQRGTERGAIAVDGWAKNVARFLLTKPDPLKPAPAPSFRIAVGLRQFHAFDKRSVADVYVTDACDRPGCGLDSIRLVGDLNAARLTGAVQVDRSAIFLADRDLARKLQTSEELFGDFKGETVVGGRAGLSTLAANTTPNFTVTLGSDVRLKSKEADVRLAGSLNVVKSTARASNLLASTNQLIPKFGLEGTLRTIGGSYTLDLGLAQRQFDVLADGTVNFTGDAENPTLDIAGQYNVKQYRDRDLGVIVHLRGPLIPYPEITFTSNADYAISQSDLVSYLVTGQPGFELNAQKSEVLAQFIGPTLSALAANNLRQFVGPWVDAVRFELGSGTQQQSGQTSSNVGQYLYGATVGVEKQVADNMFLSLNTGLCQLDPQFTQTNLLAGVGAKVEYRFKPELSTQIAIDPSTTARTCSGGQSIIGVVPQPQNFSFSLHHTFRF